MKVTNYTAGPRGINLKSGGTRWIEPGETADINKDDVVGEMPDFGKASDQAEKDGSEVVALRARVAELEAELAGKGAGKPVSLTNKSKAELLDIAKAEGVTVEDGATNADITSAIELHREDAAKA